MTYPHDEMEIRDGEEARREVYGTKMKLTAYLVRIQRNKKGITTLTLKTEGITQPMMDEICKSIYVKTVTIEIEEVWRKAEVKKNG